jgi:predicted DNA-binding transcriptional regulator YafY
MTYRLNNLAEIISWILSWGAMAEVLSPQDLREQLRQEAVKLVNMLT